MPCNGVPSSGEPSICEPGGGGLLLPIGADLENSQDPHVRAGFYLLFLFWCFSGVSIIADVFMSAIEHITSQKYRLYDERISKYRTATVWNATVANLTLMALGSSAPEIMLNVIGIYPTFLAGDLGPSTIVGSAAFNLFIIIAVCVVALPNNEVKQIKDLGVYSITAAFSVFAYVWLLLILSVISPNVVEFWEGALTFLFFWALIVIAYLADVGKLPCTSKEPDGRTVNPASTKEELREVEQMIRDKHGSDLTPQEEAALITEEFSKSFSRAVHRSHAIRTLTGGRKILPPTNSSKSQQYQPLLEVESAGSASKGRPEVSFTTAHHSVRESVGNYDIRVQCSGTLTKAVRVKYAFRNGSAKCPNDYDPVRGMTGELVFDARTSSTSIPVHIKASRGYHKPDQDFSVQLEPAPDTVGVAITRGACAAATVWIVDEDRPGVIAFQDEQMEIEGSETAHDLRIPVLRKNGFAGRATVKYKTEAASAVEGADFVRIEGTLVFEPEETSKDIVVRIAEKGRYEATEEFRVILSEISGGACFDDTTDGGSECAICTVIITGDVVARYLQVNWDKVKLGTANWHEKFAETLYVGGSLEEQGEASGLDYAMHFLSWPWKVLAACIPPTEYMGGWACFFCALAAVGFVTVLIGDTAELLGCCMGIPPSTTAITLVALGTSLPDTFASKSAALMDPTADNCVGNVTGSNSVNVFLGLGLPWGICAMYWSFVAECTEGDKWHLKFPEQAREHPMGIFVVEAGALAISVGIFSVGALLCIATLAVRRCSFGGELGGPAVANWLTFAFFCALWLIYIVVSILAGP